MLPTGASGASNAELVVDYSCTGGIALNGSTVNLRTTVSIPTTLTVGEPLNIGWALNYKNGDPARFGSPGFFGPGGKVLVTGNVQLSGSWVGVLQPKGLVDQPGKLQPGKILKLPDGISDAAHTVQAGTVKVTPRKLFVDFTPPAGEVMVNNDDPRVGYHAAADWYELNDQPLSIGDHGRDLHRTDKVNSFSTFTFTGTGIEYIARRSTEAGQVGFKIDGQDATPSSIDASKNPDGTPTNAAHQGGLTLWRFNGLKYGEHTIQVTNLEAGKFAQVDAFRVITRELANPPADYRATCTLVSAPVSVNVTISEPGGSSSPSPTISDPDPSVDPTLPTPTPTVTPTPTPTPSGTGGQNDDQSVGTKSTTTSTTTSTPKPTLTVTATVTPTRPTPTTPQVIITPSGGAQTGEAPGEGSGLGLLGAGTAMVTGSALGGVALMRRRAAHARGQRDS
ncbi:MULTISPECIES: hypothetical protein [unclassified Streptosporangium]|uniref:hypothetical protein n=1 Tax=unclassified Streptosporangium TaxID=2632669 RepID=UPI002E2AC247|nr:MULTISPECIES: hypothetical protein [unclassified Streptosporangium]